MGWLNGRWRLWESRKRDLGHGVHLEVFRGLNDRFGGEIHCHATLLLMEHDGSDTPEEAEAATLTKYREWVARHYAAAHGGEPTAEPALRAIVAYLLDQMQEWQESPHVLNGRCPPVALDMDCKSCRKLRDLAAAAGVALPWDVVEDGDDDHDR